MFTDKFAEGQGAAASQRNSAASLRFHALDSVRATAMLLGVFYHSILFAGFAGGGPPQPGGAVDPSRLVGDWLHSFRMPMFFLISGFFGRMMLDKYGTRGYLRRRWLRVGIPLFVGMFTFGPLYILTRDVTSQWGGSGPRPMGIPRGGGPPPGNFPSAERMPPPPRGFVPPPLKRFDKDDNGELSEQEWQEASREFGSPSGRGPGRGGFGPGGPPGPFGGQGNALAGRIFGSSSHYFELHHLWFLWYLLVFATIAPWIAEAGAFVVPRFARETVDRRVQQGFRWGLAPIMLALAATPALLLTSSPFGWYLGLAPAIFRAFPDFLLHLDPDMAFYLVYFLAGWLLHREREVLSSLARAWFPDLLLGLVAFAAAIALSHSYSGRISAPDYRYVRVGGYALYCLASASTAFAFLGFFLRYLDRPSRTWRYLADTALWVYLIHQPLVLVGLALVRPLELNWLLRSLLVSALSTAVALLLYECVVRPTPLVYLFGPSISRKPKTVATASQGS